MLTVDIFNQFMKDIFSKPNLPEKRTIHLGPDMIKCFFDQAGGKEGFIKMFKNTTIITGSAGMEMYEKLMKE